MLKGKLHIKLLEKDVVRPGVTVQNRSYPRPEQCSLACMFMNKFVDLHFIVNFITVVTTAIECGIYG